MEHTATFEVLIEGVKGGKPLVPGDYDIKALRALLEKVEVLLFPNNRHQRPVISYEMQEGSVRNLFYTSAGCPPLLAQASPGAPRMIE